MATDESDGLDITTRVLISIRDEIRQTNRRLEQLREETNQHLDQTNQRLEQLREETRDGLQQLREETRDGLQQLREETRNGLKTVHDSLSLRLDRVIENTGQHYRDLASRVANLELQVAAMQHG